MRYEEMKDLKDKDFKRLTGVRRATFAMMLTTLKQGWRNFGRPPKLSRADQLLLTLMYWREYRTQFHIAQTYGVSAHDPPNRTDLNGLGRVSLVRQETTAGE